MASRLWSDFVGFPDAQAVRALIERVAHAHVHACQGGYAGSAGGGAKMCDNCNQAGHIAAQVCDSSNVIGLMQSYFMCTDIHR